MSASSIASATFMLQNSEDSFDADVIVNRTAEAIISGVKWTGKEAVEIEEATVLNKEHGDAWIVLIFMALVGGVCFLLYKRFVMEGDVVEQYFEMPREKIGVFEARLQVTLIPLPPPSPSPSSNPSILAVDQESSSSSSSSSAAASASSAHRHKTSLSCVRYLFYLFYSYVCMYVCMFVCLHQGVSS
jgi:hypothetical protein